MRPYPDEARRDLAARLYAAGLTAREVGASLDPPCSKQAALKLLKKAGVARRPGRSEGPPKTPERVRAFARRSARRRYLRCVATGVCTTSGCHAEAEAPFLHCAACRDAMRRRYRGLVEAGLCVACEAAAEPGRTFCPACREAGNRRQKARRDAKKAKGA